MENVRKKQGWFYDSKCRNPGSLSDSAGLRERVGVSTLGPELLDSEPPFTPIFVSLDVILVRLRDYHSLAEELSLNAFLFSCSFIQFSGRINDPKSYVKP